MTAHTSQHPRPVRRAAPTAAVLRTEARLFGRELGSLFYILLFPVVLLGILGAIPSFRENSTDLGGMSVVDLYVPVTVLLSMIMAALMAMPSMVMAYREASVLRPDAALQTVLAVMPSQVVQPGDGCGFADC